MCNKEVAYTNLTYTTKQGSRVSFTAFGEEVQIISGSPMMKLKPLLAAASSNVPLGRGSEKVFNECLVVSNTFPSAAKAQKRNGVGL